MKTRNLIEALVIALMLHLLASTFLDWRDCQVKGTLAELPVRQSPNSCFVKVEGFGGKPLWITYEAYEQNELMKLNR